MKLFFTFLKYFFEIILAFLFYPIIVFYAIIFRSSKGSNYRIVWGPNNLHTTKNNANLMKIYGFCSESYIDEIQDNSGFDNYYFNKNNLYFKSIYRYVAFIDIIKRFDIIVTNFDGGFLRYTKLRMLEHFFLKIGSKKMVVWPYGGDSTIYTEVSDYSFRYGYYRAYPKNSLRELEIKSLIEYFNRHADFIIGNIPHHESISRWDMLTVACYGIDTNMWKPSDNYKSIADGVNQPVTIMHPTNHRHVKGTELLIEACESLKKENLKIKLIVAENMSHLEVQNQMKNCDIVAAQFLYGYALTEIEGMSLEKPVISNLENENYYQYVRNFSYLKDCPIISTRPEDLINELRCLVTDPALRQKIGKNGRTYVEKYHSASGQGLMWRNIFDYITRNTKKYPDNWWMEIS